MERCKVLFLGLKNSPLILNTILLLLCQMQCLYLVYLKFAASLMKT